MASPLRAAPRSPLRPSVPGAPVPTPAAPPPSPGPGAGSPRTRAGTRWCLLALLAGTAVVSVTSFGASGRANAWYSAAAQTGPGAP